MAKIQSSSWMLKSLEGGINHGVRSVTDSCNWECDSKQLRDVSLFNVLHFSRELRVFGPREVTLHKVQFAGKLLWEATDKNICKSMSRSSSTNAENKLNKTTNAFRRRFCHNSRNHTGCCSLNDGLWVEFAALKHACSSCACLCVSFI